MFCHSHEANGSLHSLTTLWYSIYSQFVIDILLSNLGVLKFIFQSSQTIGPSDIWYYKTLLYAQYLIYDIFISFIK